MNKFKITCKQKHVKTNKDTIHHKHITKTIVIDSKSIADSTNRHDCKVIDWFYSTIAESTIVYKK
jgi:hypothetical protein